MKAYKSHFDQLFWPIIALIAGSVAFFAMAISGCASEERRADTEQSRTMISGADISALPVFERNAGIYRYSDGTRGDAIDILHRAGMNCFRLRLFVNPDGSDVVVNNLDYTVSLAKRVKASGAMLMLDIHYSDTWADPEKQTKPAAWKNLNFVELQTKVEDYTRNVLSRFIAENVAPDYIQLGNEVTNGMLWPDGRIEFAEKEDTAAFDRFAAFQAAAHKGLDEAFAGRAAPKVVLHIESTGNIARTQWFIDGAVSRGIRWDILAFSYYPNWHGSMTDLASTLTFASQRSGKPVIVTETSNPWKLTANWKKYPKRLEFPPTLKGQKAFAAALRKTVENVPDGRGAGVFWWCPEATPGAKMNVWLGGDCGLFDYDGTVLPAARTLCGR
jgi:arabinogalactan endo-1,4-beta-galactosidase